jgi:hypothetical protein
MTSLLGIRHARLVADSVVYALHPAGAWLRAKPGGARHWQWAAFDATAIDKVRQQLARGVPVIFATRLTRKLSTLRGDAVLDEDDIPGEGHAMVAVGYDDAKRAFLADEFDITICQDMLVDHAFAVPMALLWPGADNRPVRTIPIAINTVQHPLPSAARCFRLGQAVGRAIESFQQDCNVLVLGTGGLSHQLDGERAGFINRDFDLFCMDKLVNDPMALTRYSSHEIVAQAGTQGVELLNWIAMRGALTGRVSKVHGNYHIPISNTASAVLALENDVRAEMRKAG